MKSISKIIIYKLFILLEIQLNVILFHSKLVGSLALINQLLFYNCININTQIQINPYFICNIFDIVSIPNYLFKIHNLSRKSGRYEDKVKFQPLNQYILSFKLGLLVIVAYPIILFNSSLIKIKLKYRMETTAIKSAKKFSLLGTRGVFKLQLLQAILFFKTLR